MKKSIHYKFSSLQPILDVLENGNILGPTEISEKIGRSKVLTHKYLKALLVKKLVKKVGAGPQTKYTLLTATQHQTEKQENNTDTNNIFLDYRERKLLEEHFYKLSPTGEIYTGFQE